MSREPRRTTAPFGRRAAEVTEVERLGAYVLISALDREGPADPVPGQFYMLAAADRWGGGTDERPYLGRAFSFARARPESCGVTLQFLLEAIGPGTERLAVLEVGDALLLVGPLGVGFDVPKTAEGALLVGGGIGVAPLLCLADGLPGPPAATLLGFRSGPHATAGELFSSQPQIATDDGSVGGAGLVTDLLAPHLEAPVPGARVYACGPPPMLEAVRALCTAAGVDAQLALESGMACGFGACFGCVVPTRDGLIRLCLDGPVLDAHRLDSALVPGAGH